MDHIFDEANYEEYPQLERFTDYMLKTWIDTPIFGIKNKYLLSMRSNDDLFDLLKSSFIMSEDFE